MRGGTVSLESACNWIALPKPLGRYCGHYCFHSVVAQQKCRWNIKSPLHHGSNISVYTVDQWIVRECWPDSLKVSSLQPQPPSLNQSICGSIPEHPFIFPDEENLLLEWETVSTSQHWVQFSFMYEIISRRTTFGDSSKVYSVNEAMGYNESGWSHVVGWRTYNPDVHSTVTTWQWGAHRGHYPALRILKFTCESPDTEL
jgi:hypothetical protein